MKKFITLILAIAMLLCTASCEASTDKKDGDLEDVSKNEIDISVDSDDATESETSVEDKNDKFKRIEKILDKQIYINYSAGRGCEASVGGYFFNKYSKDAVLFIYEYEDEDAFDGSYKTALDYLNDGKIMSAITYAIVAEFERGAEYKISVDNRIETKVGNIDTVKFDGSVTDANGRECFSYGYAFVMDNTPCMLVGFIFTKNQEAELISDLKDEIDGMINTVRSER